MCGGGGEGWGGGGGGLGGGGLKENETASGYDFKTSMVIKHIFKCDIIIILNPLFNALMAGPFPSDIAQNTKDGQH